MMPKYIERCSHCGALLPNVSTWLECDAGRRGITVQERAELDGGYTMRLTKNGASQKTTVGPEELIQMVASHPLYGLVDVRAKIYNWTKAKLGESDEQE